MYIYNWILVICWAVFLIVWATMSTRAKRTVSSGIWRGIGMRIALLCIAIVILSGQNLTSFNPQLYQQTLPVYWGVIGSLCAIVGIGLAVWARMYLGRNWGMPMSVKENPELVTSGPYALIRHPIYTGILLAILGSAIVAGPWWFMVFVITAIYFIYSAQKEEARMRSEFPAQYPTYKAQTKMLVPWIF